MDPRRHGKLPLSSQTSEAKEKEDDTLLNDEFDAYYASNSWSSDTDLSTMVSALSQVMGTSTNKNNPHMTQSIATSTNMVKEEPQPLLDQGLFLKLFVSFLFLLLCFNVNLAF